jgi:hypothetical protein
MMANKSLKDMLSGLIFIGFGVAFGYAALGYNIGTALRMGPGYFPLILAGIMVLLGAIIFLKSLTAGTDVVALGTVPWLGMVLILGALAFFGVTVRGLGLVPALFVTIFMSAFASARTGFLAAIVMAAGLTLLCTVIFIWALGLPLPLFGSWLNF